MRCAIPPLVPAVAGTQAAQVVDAGGRDCSADAAWIPACAGMGG